MRRFLIVFVGLVLAVAVAAAIALSTVDWNRARPWIEQVASEALGRAVSVGGEIEPRLSLVPTLCARDVRISRSLDEPESPWVELDRLDLRFPLLPLLLEGRFELRGLSASDGRIVLPGAEAGPGAPDAPASLAWLESLPAQLELANLRIELGSGPTAPVALRIEHASAGKCGERLELAARWRELPLAIAGTLACPGKSRVALEDFEATLGGSAAAGSLALDLGGKRPRLSGEIASSTLRVEELMPMASGGGPDRPWLDTELTVPRLATAFDGDLELARTEITLPWRNLKSVGDLAGRIRLDVGRFELQIGMATLWDGALVGQLHVDARESEPGVALLASLAKASVAQFFVEERATGRLDGEIELAGRGGTPRALLAGARGRARLLQGPMDFAKPPLGPLGQDLLGILFSQESAGRLRCAVLRTSLERGLGPLAIVIDSPETTLAGVGPLDLRALRLDVVLRPRPHRASVVPLKAPVLVSGPIDAPRAQLATQDLLEGLGKTALFGALDPVGLASVLVDPGTGDRNPCETALEGASVEALEQSGDLGKSPGVLGAARRMVEGVFDDEPRAGE